MTLWNGLTGWHGGTISFKREMHFPACQSSVTVLFNTHQVLKVLILDSCRFQPRSGIRIQTSGSSAKVRVLASFRPRANFQRWQRVLLMDTCSPTSIKPDIAVDAHQFRVVQMGLLDMVLLKCGDGTVPFTTSLGL